MKTLTVVLVCLTSISCTTTANRERPDTQTRQRLSDIAFKHVHATAPWLLPATFSASPAPIIQDCGASWRVSGACALSFACEVVVYIDKETEEVGHSYLSVDFDTPEGQEATREFKRYLRSRASP